MPIAWKWSTPRCLTLHLGLLGRSGVSIIAILFGLVGWGSPIAEGGSMSLASQSSPTGYSTLGKIGTSGIDGAGILEFEGVGSGTIYDPSSKTGEFRDYPPGSFDFQLG